MSSTSKLGSITYRKAAPPGASHYEVLYDGRPIGIVGRFRMGAAQFGSTWMATAPNGKKSTRFTTRDAAAKWLIKQARS